ncbi:MAG TPA: cellulose synthase complex periplasmic endoglucanase BcsZ [Acidobacteriaceae bacterium]|nr:cellulose synthase complex periplasmic endoglucanase BcsZ [Acidobacteriaceae bacterium]
MKRHYQAKATLTLLLSLVIPSTCIAQDWPSLWKGYVARFMDSQVRVIDHDAGDRTTSEGQAYGMFFALVANDRSRFDALLHWTEQNLAQGDLSTHLPAWLWGHVANNHWGVLDHNSAADADIWIAYTLLEAGKAWNEPRYAKLGTALAHQIAAEEVVEVPGLGTMVAPGPVGFHHDNSYRFNASYVPLQVILGLSQFVPDGPWKKVAMSIPTLIKDSAPHGFVSDWTDFRTGSTLQTSPTVGSYDAIRVYLWAGMLDSGSPSRDGILNSIGGMAAYLRKNPKPPAKVRPDGTIEDPNGPVGFSAALLPYTGALGDDEIRNEQRSRVQSEYKQQTGLLGNPAKYYDENLALFGLGYEQQEFRFDAAGRLKLLWQRK